MHLRLRQRLCTLLFPVALTLGGGAAAQHGHAAHGDAVTIARGTEVVLDVDPPALRSLTVDGKLSFSNDLDIGLETEWIYLRGGELEIGTEARPHTRKATITLTDNFPKEDVNTMGDRGIMLMRGTLSLHGDRTHTWTKLARTAAAGSSARPCAEHKGRRNKRGKKEQARLQAHDVHPLGRDCESRTLSLDASLQRIA